jgi:hypothetical protein
MEVNVFPSAQSAHITAELPALHLHLHVRLALNGHPINACRSPTLVPQEWRGMEFTAFLPNPNASKVISTGTALPALPYHKDARSHWSGKTTCACPRITTVLLGLTSMVIFASFMMIASQTWSGTRLLLNVFVLREHSGMEPNVWPVILAWHTQLMDVSVRVEVCSMDRVASYPTKLLASRCQMHLGMALTVFVCLDIARLMDVVCVLASKWQAGATDATKRQIVSTKTAYAFAFKASSNKTANASTSFSTHRHRSQIKRHALSAHSGNRNVNNACPVLKAASAVLTATNVCNAM